MILFPKFGTISTHTPLARRDSDLHDDFFESFTISTHTPLARRDIVTGEMRSNHDKFLLTRLLRGVTGNACHVEIK